MTKGIRFGVCILLTSLVAMAGAGNAAELVSGNQVGDPAAGKDSVPVTAGAGAMAEALAGDGDMLREEHGTDPHTDRPTTVPMP